MCSCIISEITSANGIDALPVQARRGVLGGLIGAAALLSSPKDASAAFGDAARVYSELRCFFITALFWSTILRAEGGARF